MARLILLGTSNAITATKLKSENTAYPMVAMMRKMKIEIAAASA